MELFKQKQDAVKMTPGFKMKPIQGVIHEAVVSSV